MRVTKHDLINATYVIVVLSMIGSGIFLVYRNMNPPLSSLPCRNDEIGKTIKKQYGYLENESSDLGQLAEKVLTQPKYNKSANCLYILTKHSIKEGNIEKAKQYYDQMVALQRKDPKNVPDFPGAVGIEKLGEKIGSLLSRVQDIRTNVMFTGDK